MARYAVYLAVDENYSVLFSNLNWFKFIFKFLRRILLYLRMGNTKKIVWYALSVEIGDVSVMTVKALVMASHGVDIEPVVLIGICT